MKGFKQFVLRGNVIDLAVAVVIGAAFTTIVSAIVTSIITPLIGALFNADDLKHSLVVRIPTAAGGHADLLFGAVLAAIINFLIVAAVVYFALVVPVNALVKRAFQRQQEEPASAESAPPNELDLLTQIRDLLDGQQVAHGQHVLTTD
jgi:large conductance mechanosensitive channel